MLEFHPLFRSLFLKLGGEEVEYDPGFQLYLQTKLSNPHYKPEIAAQVNHLIPVATYCYLREYPLVESSYKETVQRPYPLLCKCLTVARYLGPLCSSAR